MATASEKRALAVKYMKDREKKNTYTQQSKRTYFFGHPDNKPGNKTQKGYSDCSAAVMKAIQAAAGINIGANTSAQINNRSKGKVVHETTGYYPDESKLLPGDCLYFKGNTSHPLDVGHVEMYIGNGKCIGHGSGTGPTIKDLTTYCKGRATSKKRYFMAIRWIMDDATKGSTGAHVKVTGASVNVRTGPGTDYTIVHVAKEGETFPAPETKGWRPIKHGGHTYWISDKYSVEVEG